MRILSTTTYLALISTAMAHHRCDDVNTAETNSLAGPLAKAVQKALSDKDAAQAAKLALDNSFADNLDAVSAAEKNLAQAESQYTSTNAKVTLYHDEYAAKSKAFAACKPDDAGSQCTTAMQNQLSLQMREAGQEMIDNDNLNQKNRNIVEQMTLELNNVKSEYQFDSAAFNTKATRLIEDLNTAAATYQNLKNQLDKHTVTGTEQQEDCQLSQYNNDMAEIEKLTKLLELCKNSGCNQSDLANIGKDDFQPSNGANPSIGDVANQIQTPTQKKYHENGKIRFPDCGAKITSQCFWSHYKTSGWLDFLSVFCYVPALIGCAAFDEYDYNLCLGNFAYIVVDASSKKMAPWIPDFNPLPGF